MKPSHAPISLARHLVPLQPVGSVEFVIWTIVREKKFYDVTMHDIIPHLSL